MTAFFVGLGVAILTIYVTTRRPAAETAETPMWDSNARPSSDWKPVVGTLYPLMDNPEIGVIVTEIDTENQTVTAKLMIPVPKMSAFVNMTKLETDDDYNSDWCFDIIYRIDGTDVTTVSNRNLLGCEYILSPESDEWEVIVSEHNFFPSEG